MTTSQLQRIKQEFNEPFRETVKSFAVMGYSRRAVASILEVPSDTLIRYVRVFNLGQYFKSWKDMRPECKGKGWITGKKRKPKVCGGRDESRN